MDGKRPPAAEPAQTEAEGGGGAQRKAPGPQPELYGPLVVERHHKDDGRVLILYQRREAE